MCRNSTTQYHGGATKLLFVSFCLREALCCTGGPAHLILLVVQPTRPVTNLNLSCGDYLNIRVNEYYDK